MEDQAGSFELKNIMFNYDTHNKVTKLFLVTYYAVELSKMLYTEMNLATHEFLSYDVKTECDVTFCLKEFRVRILFNEVMDKPNMRLTNVITTIVSNNIKTIAILICCS